MVASPGDNPLRQALWPLGLVYGGAMALRNAAFALGLRAVHRLGAPVVSVGNLTVGGTGKTPLVHYLCALAGAAGRTPGVLARGYGRAPGAALNDEGLLLQQRLPALLQEQATDRVAAGRRLLARGADYLVLDDGFQHRRLHRDVDVVCLDAERPFGNGLCLPAGDLREFRSGLRRADVVVLTRAGRLGEAERAARVVRVHQLAGRVVPVHACEHEPRDLLAQPRGVSLPLTDLRHRRVMLWSAIARPLAFRRTAEAAGAIVAGELRHRDHHRFTPGDVERAAAAARAADAVLLVTEKDDVRLAGVAAERLVLRIELRWLDAPPPPREFLL